MSVISQVLLHVFLFHAVVLADENRCKCPHLHLQDAYCHSEHIFIAEYKKSLEVENSITETHVFSVFKVVKGRFERKLRQFLRFEANITMPRTCTMDLLGKQGKEFIIFASLRMSGFYTDKCMGSRLWINLTDEHKKGISKNYLPGCMCSTSAYLYARIDLCHYKHSYLAKTQGQCDWIKTESFKNCNK